MHPGFRHPAFGYDTVLVIASARREYSVLRGARHERFELPAGNSAAPRAGTLGASESGPLRAGRRPPALAAAVRW